MGRLAALLTIALPLLTGCSTRGHLNPFDPANPETGGRPAGFQALAANQSVRLRWRETAAAGLVGHRLYRRTSADTVFIPITDVLPPTTTTHADFGLLNGVEHAYRLYFVFESGPAGAPAEARATPGPLRPWVADYRGGRLVRLSADGRVVAESLAPTAARNPVAVDVYPRDGTVWAVGPGSDVLVYNVNSGQQSSVGQGISSAVSVVVDRVDGSAWVGDAGDDRVVHLLSNGAPADPPLLSGLDYPGDLALDRADGTLWVVEQDGDRVRKYTSDGAAAATATVSRPSRVALDTLTHEAWVTSFEHGRVVRLSRDGVPLDTVAAFEGPIGIAVDAVRGRIWVADALADEVVALDPSGTIEFRVAGQPEAREIALDGASGEAWVTLTAAGAVSRLSPAGHEILRRGGLRGPWGIALDDVTWRPFPLTARD
jgi:DNA-binding beta-propeller fold protein YncE